MRDLTRLKSVRLKVSCKPVEGDDMVVVWSYLDLPLDATQFSIEQEVKIIVVNGVWIGNSNYYPPNSIMKIEVLKEYHKLDDTSD